MDKENIEMKKSLDDLSLKQDILNKMFLELSKESLLDILEILEGYAGRLHKSKQDTLLSRCMFAYGYHSTREFFNQVQITKDNALAQALRNNASNIKTLNDLRQAFNIRDDIFVKIVKEICEDIGDTNVKD